MSHLGGIAATSTRFSIIKITSLVLALLLFSFSISPVLANPERAPELETVTFIDVFRPTHLGDNQNEDASCRGTASSFKTIRGGIRWRVFPVTYHIDASASGVGAAANAVRAAANTWDNEEHPADMFFLEIGDVNSAKVTVAWASIDGPSGTLAVTGITFNPATKTIVSASLTFDSDDDWAIQSPIINCAGAGSGAAHDVENVGAHEFGHVVGLDHVNDDTRLTMYKFITQAGETMKRTLGPGDREGIFALYGVVVEGPPEDPPEDPFCPPGQAKKGNC